MAGADLIRTVCTVLCRSLTPAQAEELLTAADPVSLPAGAEVFREGGEGDGLYLFHKGSVEIVKQGGDGSPQWLATVEAPSVLGEMSLVTASPHSATARTLTDCEFRLLTRAEFHRLLAAENLAAYKLLGAIAEVLSRRLLRMDEKVVELLGQRGNSKPVEELVRFKQKLFSEWSF
jgi:CRP-like cAMP-binding protein